MTVQDRPPSGKYRLRVGDYRLLDEAGTFGDRPTELIDGDVILMSPEYRPHLFVKSELAFLLRLALRDLGSSLFVGIEGSVLLSEHDEPRPDIILTSEPRGEGPIPAASVALLVEVSSTTKSVDLNTKGPLYARFGIPEYWVADVNGRVIHRLWSPAADRYALSDKVAFGRRIEAATLPGLGVETGGLA